MRFIYTRYLSSVNVNEEPPASDVVDGDATWRKSFAASGPTRTFKGRQAEIGLRG